AQLIPGSECEPSLLVNSPPRNLLMGRMALDHGRIESAGVVKATGSGRDGGVEVWRGGLGVACLLPALSAAGA
ncbi:MAG TPA: hypothetical protein VKU44_02765, partial [Terriglobia bacterium]|nr:hypothetical protein [Terriglobia bacterium]